MILVTCYVLRPPCNVLLVTFDVLRVTCDGLVRRAASGVSGATGSCDVRRPVAECWWPNPKFYVPGDTRHLAHRSVASASRKTPAMKQARRTSHEHVGRRT